MRAEVSLGANDRRGSMVKGEYISPLAINVLVHRLRKLQLSKVFDLIALATYASTFHAEWTSNASSSGK